MGFDLQESVITNGPCFSLKPVGISHTLFTYKTWLETQVIMNSDAPRSWHYYNCSEEGALGVMAKSTDPSRMNDKDNWYLLDEKIGHRYHTRKLEEAVCQFLMAKQALAKRKAMEILTDAKSATILHQPMGTVPPVGIN